MKEKMMNFRDGSALVTIGMEIVTDNGQGGRHYHLHPTKVIKVGNKIVTLENGMQFYFDGRQKTNYSSGSIYSSQAGYDRYTVESKIISKVLDVLRSYSVRLTYEQAIKIAQIMNINLEET